jgi:hypothetical protein
MVDRSRLNSSAPERHLEGVEHQLGPEMVGHRPARHHPAKGVDHHGQEEKPGPGRDVSDVSDQQLARPTGLKVALDQVGRRRCLWRAQRGPPAASTMHAMDAQ